MKSLLLALTLLAGTHACSAQPTPDAVKKAHATTHKIEMPSLIGDSGHCSATAIGPHALLTATHCETASPVLTVDGKDAKVVSTMGDGIDHTIYLLDGVTFDSYADVATEDTLAQGEDVFLFGNPASFSDMFRRGYVSGSKKVGADTDDDDEDEGPIIPFFFFFRAPKPPAVKIKTDASNAVTLTYFDFNGFFGDSGSGIFNDQGKVVAVTSIITGSAEKNYGLKFMGGYTLRLTKEQLKTAREFGVK